MGLFLLFIFRGFSLHDALLMIEEDDIEAESLTLLPPINACEDITDEDSGKEDDFDINNLPPSQIQSQAEVAYRAEQDSDWDSEDELPLSTFLKKKKTVSAVSKKQYHFVREDLPSDTYRFPDSEENNINPACSPSDLFFLFFDDQILQTITDETNRYSQQKNKNISVDLAEIKCFIGVSVLSGYVPVPRRRMYWEKSKDSHNEQVAEAISRDKFEHIMSHIHFTYNMTLDKSDKYAKVRPLIRYMNDKFLQYGYAEENHSIDEAMVPYYGRHGCKQYIHGKPIRYGYKLWVGASRLGYIYWFEPYQGASTYVNDVYKSLGVGASVVLSYADRLREKWNDLRFHFFFDNFFSSAILFEKLEEKHVCGTGTIRENRIPKNNLTDSKVMKKYKRGTFDYQKVDNSNLIFVKWNDNNVVTFGSNIARVFPLHAAKRYSQKEKKFINIDQPDIVKSYNRNMGGVDRSDQNMSLYRVSTRGKKWYFPLVSHCIDMAVNNAWLLYRKQGGTIGQLEFRRIIAVSILEKYKKNPTYQRGRPSSSTSNDVRYDRIDHIVIPQATQTRCRNCHQKTTTRCSKCDVGVHVKCFMIYHSL